MVPNLDNETEFTPVKINKDQDDRDGRVNK